MYRVKISWGPSRSALFGGFFVSSVNIVVFKETLVWAKKKRINRRLKPVENYYIILIIYI